MQTSNCTKEAKELLLSYLGYNDPANDRRINGAFDILLQAAYCQKKKIPYQNLGNGIIVNSKCYHCLTPDAAKYYGFNHRTPLVPIFVKTPRGERAEFLGDLNRVINTPQGTAFAYSDEEIAQAIEVMCAE